MALKSVNTRVGTSKKTTGLVIGEKLVGYITGFEPSLQDPNKKNILMRGEDGSTFRVYTSGNIPYMVNDGKIRAGLYTEIIRLADKMVKGKSSSQFDVQQDDERTLDNVLETSQAVSGSAQDASSVTPSDVKKRAAAIASQVQAARAANK